MTADKLRLVLCWHMHQPQYRDALDGAYLRPWTWLHGIKDYSDMAAHLETVPGARAVVNFSTILLQQLSDYAERIARWKDEGAPIGDPLLDALAGRTFLSDSEKLKLTEACLHANEVHMIGAFPPFASLIARAKTSLEQESPLDDQTFRDLLVWYPLAWTGESLRREFPMLRGLLQKAEGFSGEDARQFLLLIGEVLAGLIPRYRKLGESGRVELSLTPHAHPILPLLMDIASARDAMPAVTLPDCRYPGGEGRCRWHIERSLAVFEQYFGVRPRGCWPSEGGVSEAVLPLLGDYGFAWTATGTNVLRNSIGKAAENAHLQMWHESRGKESIACFFRDDELSDRIGFQYARWGAEDAVNDFIARLEVIRHDWKGSTPPVVSIIMDGENAWEHFPYNAWFFLRHLYSRLVQHPHIDLTTFSALLGDGWDAGELPHLVAGSWVYGDFSVWIGDPQKNRAWELLCAAKRAVDRVLGQEQGRDREAILEQLGICEASDWFWWLGGGNTAEDSAAFDSLFREHLMALYRLLGEAPPGDLAMSGALASSKEGAEGAMRRANR
ncbi:MAG: glycoside hydrolase family 57 protein [Woeseia sp.]